jgi:nitrite reductase/ring-hydroxylating ferredoxin subunit
MQAGARKRLREFRLMTCRGGWYPMALSNGLEPGRSAGTRVFDRELCIWRDADGVAHAWEDRCPHRGMRLSFGFVRGNHIACLYHGWQYDTNGQCRLIPAHPALDVPSTICVPTYPCVERLGMVWIYSDRDVAATPNLPYEAREVTPVRSLYVDRAPDAVLRELAAGAEDVGSAGVMVLSLDAGGQKLLAGFQPFGKAKTALHIVLLGGAGRAPARRAAAIWAEELRRDLERGANAVVAPQATREAAP